MYRTSKDPKDEVTLFIGCCRLIVINNKKQIDFAIRTVQLTQTMLFTYNIHEQSRSRSKSQIKDKMLQLDELTQHQYQYKISKFMRPKLIMQTNDSDVFAYLKGLGTPSLILQQGETINIVAIAIDEQSIGKYINGFLFTQPNEAIEFYQAVNRALGYQLYCNRLLSANLPFNYHLSNFIGNTLNGKCLINPLDYSDGKEQEQEIKLISSMLQQLNSQTLFNFEQKMMLVRLVFKIIDQKSTKYGQQFLLPICAKIQNLELKSCSLTNYRLSDLFSKISKNMKELKKLNLCQNNLNDDMLPTLSNIMQSSQLLHQIDLSSNQITFQKQGILNAFLQAIGKYKIQLNVSNNQICNVRTINKFFVNAEGIIPLSVLDIQNNLFRSDHLAMLAKAYLQRKQVDHNYSIQIKIGQIEFEDVSAFQVLTREHRKKAPTAMSVPLTMSRHSVVQQQQSNIEANKGQAINQLLRRYQAQSIAGNFYLRKKIRQELLQLGVDSQVIENEPIQIRIHRQQQQKYISTKLQKCINYQSDPAHVLTALNDGLKLARRKGLTGSGINFLAFVKRRIQVLIQKWDQNKQFSRIVRQVYSKTTNKYTNLLEAAQEGNNYMLGIDYLPLTKMSQSELQGVLKAQQYAKMPDLYLVCCYLLLQNPPPNDSILLQCLQQDPRMVCSKILRNTSNKNIKFKEVQRVYRVEGRNKTKNLVDIVSRYGIQGYKFSEGFIQSRQSSSGYPGMLSSGRFQTQHVAIIQSFIQIFNNYMQILYQSPDQISQQGFQYSNAIANYLIDRQKQSENQLKATLAEELFIRMITYYDSQKHKPLKRGLLLLLFQFLMRRIGVGEDLAYRIIAYLSKTQSLQLQHMNLHFSQKKMPWQGKIDWKIKDMQAVKELILGRGKMKIAVADISNQKLGIQIQVDELDTVSQIWNMIKSNHLQSICSWGSVNKSQIDSYWLCGIKSNGQPWDVKLLSSYEHIGKIIFEEHYLTKLLIRKVIYHPQYHSLPYIKSLQYQSLITLFMQYRQSFRESANVLLKQDPQNIKVKLTVESIWIDCLIQQQILLAELRQNQSKRQKYKEQRQKILNQALSKIYIKYLPTGANLNQQNRTAVLTEIRQKKNEAIPQIMSQLIKTKIIEYVNKLGIIGYSTKISDSRNISVFYVNNKSFIFIDKSANMLKMLQIQFKSLLWLQLCQEDKIVIKIDFIDSRNNNQRVRISVSGQTVWLAQCYSIIISICRLRLEYPVQLLFKHEDHPKGMPEVQVNLNRQRMQQSYENTLELTQYVQFDLPRYLRKQKQHNQKSQLSLSKNSSQKQLDKNSNIQKQSKINNNDNRQQKQKKQQKQRSNIVKSSQKQQLQPVSGIARPPKPPEQSRIDISIPSIPERSSEASKRRPSQQSMEIDEIVEQKGEKQNQVVPARRSSKNSSSRRRSRNR